MERQALDCVLQPSQPVLPRREGTAQVAEAAQGWIASIEAADQERVSKKAQPLTGGPLMEGKAPNLSQELLATGFGPEVFQDDEDPTANTKMIT
jgi:hypothetical protein